ncbi:MAG: hypothetical protein Q8M15_17065 [Bacteroidota bacterium]|nr:hypothetical protein [Bacteroidota bacterium]
MNDAILKIRDLESLTEIKDRIGMGLNLNRSQLETIKSFLSSLPASNELISKKLVEKTPIDMSFEIQVWNLKTIWPHLEKWRKLFSNFPDQNGYIQAVIHEEMTDDNPEAIKENVIIESYFFPSVAHLGADKSIGIYLKADGTARFVLTTLTDLEEFPELYHFKGTWEDTYFLVIETLKKGWPKVKFPKKLQPLI